MIKFLKNLFDKKNIKSESITNEILIFIQHL